MTTDDFRKLALAFEGATEGAHMAHPDFRAKGKVFASIHPGDARGMVKLTPDQQETFVRTDPHTFAPASGAWGRQGYTTVHFAAADAEIVGEAMTLAWQSIATATAHKKLSQRKSTGTT